MGQRSSLLRRIAASRPQNELEGSPFARVQKKGEITLHTCIFLGISVIGARENKASLRVDVSVNVALLRWLQGRNSTRRKVQFAAAVFLFRSVRVLSHSCGTIRLRRCSTEMTRSMRGAVCETVSCCLEHFRWFFSTWLLYVSFEFVSQPSLRVTTICIGAAVVSSP